MSLEPATSLPVIQRDSDPDVDWDRRAVRPGLPPRTRRAAIVVAAALFSRDDGPPPAARLEWMADDLSDFFAHVSLRAQLLFRACLATIYFLAPLTIFRLRTMNGLSIEDRVRALHAIERTPLSLPLLGMKAMLCIVYYEHPDAAAELGWDQECMK